MAGVASPPASEGAEGGPESTSGSAGSEELEWRVWPPPAWGTDPSARRKALEAPGTPVFVWLKSDRSTGRATVLSPEEAPVASTSGSGDGGEDRLRVRFVCGKEHHVRLLRLLPVFAYTGRRPVIVVCAKTDDFRRLARSQLGPSDRVVSPSFSC